MTLEVVLLALASSVRPTSLAAVYALLGQPAPRRLMLAYIAGGLLFTIGFGLVVVVAFQGISINSGHDEARGIAEIVGGCLALAFGLLILTGRVGAAQPEDAPGAPSRWRALLERRLTPRTAALAGPVTHIPGLFYFIALNVIAAHHLDVAAALAEVLLYNLVWFTVPIAAFAICVVDPARARTAIDALAAWAAARTRTLLLAISLGAGAALIVRGVLAL